MNSTTAIQPSHAPSVRKNGSKAWSRLASTTDIPTGKNWHQERKPFRLNAGQTNYAKRLEDRKAAQAMKALEREMKEEKETKRQASWIPFYGGESH
jgi:hypothetical protein